MESSVAYRHSPSPAPTVKCGSRTIASLSGAAVAIATPASQVRGAGAVIDKVLSESVFAKLTLITTCVTCGQCLSTQTRPRQSS